MKTYLSGDFDAIGYNWWYNWNYVPGTSDSYTAEFVPMIYGRHNVGNLDNLPPTASHILGFNEPNMDKQANMTPAEACELWPQLEAAAQRLNASLGSPGINHCEPKPTPAGGGCTLGAWEWLTAFLEACPSAKIDFIHTHYYGCSADSVIDYVTELSTNFSVPIWLTEFACQDNSMEKTLEYMQEIVPRLEALPPSVLGRYAWFDHRTNATGINTNTSLLSHDSSEPSQLGTYYGGAGKVYLV